MKRVLTKKLKELGYKFHYMEQMYVKDNIHLDFDSDGKIITHYVNWEHWIENEDDIQYLKDCISYYEEQLKIMQKDLEVLRNVE